MPTPEPPVVAPLPDTPHGDLPTCKLASGDAGQWFALKLPKRPESNITVVKEGKGYMVAEFSDSADSGSLKFENNDIAETSPLAATLASVSESSSTLMKIKYSSQLRNGFESHGLLVAEGGVGFWLFSSEPIDSISKMAASGCAASYICIPVGSSLVFFFVFF
jgi:hypothetical protein